MEKINKLQISAIIKIPKGKLELFKQLATESIRLASEGDTGILKYDWFISSDQTECEIREEFKNSEALIEHAINLREALENLLSDFPQNHMKLYGDPSPELLKMIKEYNVDTKVYSFFQGLEEMIEA